MKYKEIISAAAGAAGAFIVKLTGGWNGALTTLLIFMAVDYLSGLILAGVFKKSPKSENGALESHAGFKGLVRKGIILTLVMLAFRLDTITGQDFIADGVIIAFITNEAISITENAALIGVPLPAPLIRAIDVLKTDNRHRTAEDE
ncbi:MAG: phage holin family protein [Clostridia bacterium]|nr:phage holin family protein [Clostridia bacterium]